MGEIEIVPYVRADGVPTYRDSELSSFYTDCFDDHIGNIIFHDASIKSAEEFVSYAKRPTVIFCGVFFEKSRLGMFWLNRLERTHAYCHFVVYKKFWGSDYTLRAGIQVIRFCMCHYPLIMGMLPSTNKFAINYVQRLGFKLLGEIPHLIWSEKKNEPVTGTVVYITREMFDESLYQSRN